MLMAWAGIVLMARKHLPNSVGPALVVSGALLAMVSIGILSASVMPASILGLVVGGVLAVVTLWKRWQNWRLA